MLVITSFIMVIAFFRLLRTTRRQVNEIKDEVFKSSYFSLHSTCTQINDSGKVVKGFDRCAHRILQLSSIQAYGDEDFIPIEKYASFKRLTQGLKRKVIASIH